jgi:PLP dependent protein
MLATPQFSPKRLAAVRDRIGVAVAAAGRPAGSATLIGVTKTQPADVVAAARDAGLQDFGENYLQEALPKIASLPREGVVWHYIGQLQSNKTRPVAEQFDWVHTVDRLKLAERLSAQRPHYGPPLNVCLQVKLADEPGKGGVPPEELRDLAHAVAGLPRLALRGLMCIPPESDEPAVQRGRFAAMRNLYHSLRASGLPLDTLSMGMSADLEAAIFEGATHVRIGTALFGSRNGT